MALPQPVTDALLHGTGVFAPFLELTRACESGDDATFARVADELHLSNRQGQLGHLAGAGLGRRPERGLIPRTSSQRNQKGSEQREPFCLRVQHGPHPNAGLSRVMVLRMQRLEPLPRHVGVDGGG